MMIKMVMMVLLLQMKVVLTRKQKMIIKIELKIKMTQGRTIFWEDTQEILRDYPRLSNI